MHRRNHKEPLPWVDLAMLAVVASFFGYSSVALWKAPGEPSRAPATVSPAPVVSRAPASIESTPAPVVERSTKVFDLGCVGSAPTPLVTEASLLQVQGKVCAGGKIHGRNDSTDESLQIFEQSHKFTTHYFPLLEGRNRIVLEEGKRRSVLEVERKK